jgi:glycosyltransferase involved in cell wall biosynthesis
VVKVSIVVPVLNEGKILENSLERLAAARPPSQWEILVVDSGSRDDSPEIARRVCETKGWRFIGGNFSAPSVGRTVSLGAWEATGDVILVLPCDAYFESFSLFETALAGGVRCGGFPKIYEPTTRLLSAYAAAQNLLRSHGGRHLVWTNGMFFPRGTHVPTQGFLEDVALSDELRRRKDWCLVPEPIRVSARRYYPDRTWRRILINGLILFLHRLNLMGITSLRRLYRA